MHRPLENQAPATVDLSRTEIASPEADRLELDLKLGIEARTILRVLGGISRFQDYLDGEIPVESCEELAQALHELITLDKAISYVGREFTMQASEGKLSLFESRWHLAAAVHMFEPLLDIYVHEAFTPRAGSAISRNLHNSFLASADKSLTLLKSAATNYLDCLEERLRMK